MKIALCSFANLSSLSFGVNSGYKSSNSCEVIKVTSFGKNFSNFSNFSVNSFSVFKKA